MTIPELYDPECELLAEHFLQHEPFTRLTASEYTDRVRLLSIAIQRAIEDWLASNCEDDGADVIG